MKLIIDIPEEDYKRGTVMASAIKEGTPLPKGHGRLIDEGEISLRGIHFATSLDHAMMIGRLNSAPTIIEADKAESEDKE